MEGMHYLDYLNNFVSKLRSTNSRSEKEEILSKWWKEQEDFCSRFKAENHLLKLFHYVYDYDKQYYVTSANILKKDLTEKRLFAGKNYPLLWDLLEDLSNRLITGHNAIISVQQFLKKHTESQQKLILDIIDKDLKCGLSEITINKVCGNIIKTYNVALAERFDANKHTLTSDWLIERKLDGCLEYNTLIKTNKGDLKIGDIVENKIKCRVLTFNHDKVKLEYKKINNYLKNYGTKKVWYKIETYDGKELIVTGNHKIFIPSLNAYRSVEQLKEGDDILFIKKD